MWFPQRRLGGWVFTLVTVSGFVASAPAPAQTGVDAPEVPQTRTLSPYFVVQDGDSKTHRMPLLGTEVQVHISGVVADVTVTQSYRNDGSRPLHARYVFPASTRAAVHGLVMRIGAVRIVAKIKEREEAKQTFVTAKKKGQNAALLQQQRPNVFSMNVANVMPGQQIDVELHYTELLVPEAGVYEFVYPTVVGPRYSTVQEAGAADTDLWLQTPYLQEGERTPSTFRLSGSLSTGIPLDSLQCPSHEIVVHRIEPNRVQLSLDAKEEHGGDRDFVLRYRLDGGRIQSGLLLYAAEEENFFLMMLQPPRRVHDRHIPRRETLFVVDVSGSMRGFPLQTAKELLQDLVGHLRPTDSFNLLFFSGGSQFWSERSRPATPANVQEALGVLQQQRGGGGTELLRALQRAMDMPQDPGTSRSLVIVTDGFIAAEREVFAHIRRNLGEANVFAFGIGSSVNRFLIEGIAEAGHGEAFIVLAPGEAREQARRFREYVLFPVLTDIRVECHGFQAYALQPAAIPDLLAARPIVVQGKWRGLPQGEIVVTGVCGEGAFRRVLKVDAFEPQETHAALRHLWARARIGEISNEARFRESQEDRRQLVELGIAYSMLTRHTSFVAVHEVVVNPGGDGAEVQQPLPLPAGVSNSAIGAMGSGDEPGAPWLLALLLGAVALAVLTRRGLAGGWGS